MLKLNVKYLMGAALIFVIEFIIAVKSRDNFIRPFIGDVLVVILLYCALRGFLKISYKYLLISVFVFACLIEIGQYFDYVKLLGFEKTKILSIIMGRTFESTDFLAYFIGCAITFIFEFLREKQWLKQNP